MAEASFRYGDVMATTLLFPAHVLFGDVDGDDPAALLNARTRMHFVDNIYGRFRVLQLDFATRFRPGAAMEPRRGGGARRDGEQKSERVGSRGLSGCWFSSIALVCFTIQRRSATLFKYSGCSVVVGVRQ